jgi:two-component system, chemotaxis family, sensor kinase CheA
MLRVHIVSGRNRKEDILLPDEQQLHSSLASVQIMQKLEVINQQLHGLVEKSPAGLALFDARPPYQVLLHNIVYQEFFPEPFRSGGMLGKYLPDYVPTAEEEGISEVFREVASTRQGKTIFNFVYDGMPRGRTWWNWYLAPVIKDGEVTALAMTALETTHEVLARQQLETELTERKRVEDALRQSRDEMVAVNAELEEANRARSQFLSTMSHELRTPLASIIGFAEMLLLEEGETAGLGQSQHNDLERILKNGEHLLGLINDVLDLSKIEAGRMDVPYSQVDVKQLLTSVIEETQSMAIAQHLALRVEVEEGLDCLESNPMKLHQILLNLVSNALKFTEQGEVTVSARRVISPGAQADRVALAVKDSGIGISVDMQKHIFEAFYQVDGSYTRKFSGTGLGLSIVRQLTTLLGGTIEVTSTAGQGSTFTVLLPIKAAHQPVEQPSLRLHPAQPEEVLTISPSTEVPTPVMLRESLAASANGDASAGQHHVVLAVDDNPDTIVLIKKAFKDTHYQVVGVTDAFQAMERIQAVRPCAIILDVMMPDFNGWQLLHQLKDDPATASIPVIMLTVITEPATGYVLGADDYLIKPFRQDILVSTLERLVASRGRSSQDSERETLPV